MAWANSVCLCLPVTDKDTKVAGKVAGNCPPLAGVGGGKAQVEILAGL